MADISKDRIRSALLVADAHCDPRESQDTFERFPALGHYAAKHQPHVVVIGGDWGEFAGANAKRGATILGGDGGAQQEGRRIESDEAAFIEALEAFEGPIRQWNRRRGRRPKYQPERAFLEGNHEGFLRRPAQAHPAIGGKISIDRIRGAAERLGYEWYEQDEVLDLGGAAMRHQFSFGGKGQAAGISTIYREAAASSVSWHTHKFDVRAGTDAFGRLRQNIVGPVYRHPSQCRGFETSGILWLTNIERGQFSWRMVPTEEILSAYYADLRGSKRRARAA